MDLNSAFDYQVLPTKASLARHVEISSFPSESKKAKTSAHQYFDIFISANPFKQFLLSILVWGQLRPKLCANQFTSLTCVQPTITFRTLKILGVYPICNKNEVAFLLRYFHTTWSVVLSQFVSVKISLNMSSNQHFQIFSSSSHTTVLIIPAFTDWIDGVKIVLLGEPIEVFSKVQKSRRSRSIYFKISTYLCVGNILIASRNPLANGLLSIFRRVICK